MKRKFSAILAVMLAALSLAASAGSISGKVSGVERRIRGLCGHDRGQNFPAPAEHPMMDQKGLLFQPHIMVVQVGTTVDFLNSDKVAHNVFWPSVMQGSKKLPGKNLGTWPKGEKRPFKFDQAGSRGRCCAMCIRRCPATSLSVPTPYYAKTDKSGDYKIENVPDGQYNVVAWHEGAKTSTKAVTCRATRKQI